MNNKINSLHGGDLDEISRLYNIKKSDILNFSGNVNPLGLPTSVKTAIKDNLDAIIGYPDVSYLQLKQAISEYTNINHKYISVGNGSTELISTFIKVVKPQNSIVISPAYSEYIREINLVGGKVQMFPLKEEDNYILNIDNLTKGLTNDIDLLVICNPNNPTGTYITANEIRQLLIHCQKNHTYLMIDETYVEFSDLSKNISAMSLIEEFNNLYIIRGTSKFFAIPGLRLGYSACSNSKILEQINLSKDPWSVNTLAEISGKVMFVDTDFITKSYTFINSERKRMYNELTKFKNIKVYDTQSNFFLCKLLRDDITSTTIFKKLIDNNILIRDASNFPYLGDKYLRFCILDEASNTLLLKLLKELIE